MDSLEIIKSVQKTSSVLIKNLLDAVLPKTCLQCEKEGGYVCNSCIDKLERLKNAGVCVLCKRILAKKERTTFGNVCKECKKEHHIDGAIVPFAYNNKLIEKSIRALKYRGAREIAGILAYEIYKYYLSIPYITRPADITDAVEVILVPMPLYRSKELSRGFNQSELIANELIKHIGWSINMGIAKRVKRTASQTTLTKNERRYNMKDAFAVKENVQSRTTYIIIDDVITSGISVGSLASSLKQKGATRVWAMAVAHG